MGTRLGSIAVVAVAWLAPAIAIAGPYPIAFPEWVKVPAEQAYDYPATDTKAPGPPPSGAVVLRCRWHQDGELDRCRVISEAPTGLGFGNLARFIATLSLAVSPPATALAPNGDVDIPVSFDGHAALRAALRSKPGAHVVTAPDWIAKPSSADLMRYYPDLAQRYNLGGQARIVCYVTAEGSLDRCRVLFETPEGYGIGDAALAAAKLFVMKPMTVDGQPVAGALVVIPFSFTPPPMPTVTKGGSKP